MGGNARSTMLSVLLFSVCCLTKPGKESLKRVLHAWVRRQQGFLGEMLARGALLVDSISGNPPQLLCHDLGLFSIADLTSIDEDSEAFVAIGGLGQWVGIRVALGRGATDVLSRLTVFRLGSALD